MARSAADYRSIALAAAKQCNRRIAVKMVVEEYLGVLRPYLANTDIGDPSSRLAIGAVPFATVTRQRIEHHPTPATDFSRNHTVLRSMPALHTWIECGVQKRENSVDVFLTVAMRGMAFPKRRY